MNVTVPRHSVPGPDDEGYAHEFVRSVIERIESLDQSPRMIDTPWNSGQTCVQARDDRSKRVRH